MFFQVQKRVLAVCQAMSTPILIHTLPIHTLICSILVTTLPQFHHHITNSSHHPHTCNSIMCPLNSNNKGYTMGEVETVAEAGVEEAEVMA